MNLGNCESVWFLLAESARDAELRFQRHTVCHGRPPLFSCLVYLYCSPPPRLQPEQPGLGAMYAKFLDKRSPAYM